MKRTTLLASFYLSIAAVPLCAQTQITTSIGANQATQIARIAVPRPETELPLETINTPFFAPLTRDLAYSGVFAIAPIPPNIPASADLAKAANAQFVLALKIDQQGQDFIVDAKLLDSTGAMQFGKRYRGRRRRASAHRAHAGQRSGPRRQRQTGHLPLADRLRLEPHRQLRDLADGLGRREPAPDHAPQRAVDSPELVRRQRADGLHLLLRAARATCTSSAAAAEGASASRPA